MTITDRDRTSNMPGYARPGGADGAGTATGLWCRPTSAGAAIAVCSTADVRLANYSSRSACTRANTANGATSAIHCRIGRAGITRRGSRPADGVGVGLVMGLSQPCVEREFKPGC